jgi:HTH-type transcriptional regulator, fmd operon transcriptional regulator
VLKDVVIPAQSSGDPIKHQNVSGGDYNVKYQKSELGFLTRKQFQILYLRDRGFLQREIALEMHMSRSSVSMIETRARRQVVKARQTLKVLEGVKSQSQHVVRIERGTKLQRIPLLVLQDADKYQVHLRSNMVDILRMVKKFKGDYLVRGKTTRRIILSFNERGRLQIQS